MLTCFYTERFIYYESVPRNQWNQWNKSSKYWKVYTACSSNNITSLIEQMSNFLFHVAKNESLQGGVSFLIICGYSKEHTDSSFFSNISRYSKDIQIKGIAWRWPLTNSYWTLSVFKQKQINCYTFTYICHCNTNMQQCATSIYSKKWCKITVSLFGCERHIPVMLKLPFIMALSVATLAIKIIITIYAPDSCIFITNDTPWYFLLHLIVFRILL